MERFHRHHMKAKELIASGVLGELVSLKAQWSFDYPKGDGIWRQDIRLGGGGGFMDVGTHCIDILRYMTGLEAEEVVALTGNQFYDYTVEDSSQLLARMNNGATMYISSNYNMSTEPVRFEICGRKGAIFGEGSFSQCGKEAKVYIRMLGEAAKPLEFEGEHNNMYTAEMAAFSEAILQNTTPPVPAEEGLRAQQVVEAAYKSQETGTRVKVER
jgi:predicted dehydrogenase